MSWIKCSERMPEPSVFVVIVLGQRVTPAKWCEEFWLVDDATYARNETTHWQPLPEPPND